MNTVYDMCVLAVQNIVATLTGILQDTGFVKDFRRDEKTETGGTNTMSQEEIQERISELEQTYAQTEAKIDQTTGREQDAAIRYLASCGNELDRLRNMLK
jgi:hypothetical protein